MQGPCTGFLRVCRVLQGPKIVVSRLRTLRNGRDSGGLRLKKLGSAPSRRSYQHDAPIEVVKGGFRLPSQATSRSLPVLFSYAAVKKVSWGHCLRVVCPDLAGSWSRISTMPALNSLTAEAVKGRAFANGHGTCSLPCPAACPAQHCIQHRLTLRSTGRPIDQASINGLRESR